MLRYFKAADDAYESLRRALDDAWGYPNDRTLTASCLPAASMLPHEQFSVVGSVFAALGGPKPKAYIRILAAHCDIEPARALLAEALSAGTIQEVTPEQYALAVPTAATRRRQAAP